MTREIRFIYFHFFDDDGCKLVVVFYLFPYCKELMRLKKLEIGLLGRRPQGSKLALKK